MVTLLFSICKRQSFGKKVPLPWFKVASYISDSIRSNIIISDRCSQFLSGQSVLISDRLVLFYSWGRILAVDMFSIDIFWFVAQSPAGEKESKEA